MNDGQLLRCFIRGQVNSACTVITSAIDICTGPDDRGSIVALIALTKSIHEMAVAQLNHLDATAPPLDPPRLN